MGTRSRHLLRLHLAPFCLALVALTTLMLAGQVEKRLPELRSEGVPSSVIVEMFVLSVLFIVAVTLPMAVLIAVLRVFTRLGADSEIGVRRWSGVGVLRLIAPALVAAACVAAGSFLWNDRILPRSNHRLRTMLAHIEHPTSPSADAYKSSRDMSTSELRQAVTYARDDVDRAMRGGSVARTEAARQRQAMFEVELQKKYSIAATCFVLALFGAAMGLSLPSRGMALVLGISTGTFICYYVSLIGGEELAERLIISPFLGMWTLNLLFAAIGVLVLWRVMRLGWGADGQGLADPEPSR